MLFRSANVAIGANFTSQLAILSNSSIAADNGGGIVFGSKYSANAFAYYAAIKTGKDDATSGNYGGYLQFATRANGGSVTERMRITSGGLVGIGVTPTSGNKFWVRGTSTSSGNTSFYVDNSAATTLFYIKDNGEIIMPSGNVGIGTSSPNSILHTSTSLRYGIRSDVSLTGTNNNFLFLSTNNFNYGVMGGVSADGTSGGDKYGLGYTASAGTSMTPVLTWTSGGNVGIGTSSPVTYGTRNLDVNAGSGLSAYIVARANSNGGTVELAFDTDAGYISTKSNHPMIFRTNDVERMRITSGGDVAIGDTTSDSYRLKVKKSDYGLYITAGSTSTHSPFIIQDGAGTSTYFRVRGDGNIFAVGIYNNTSASGTQVNVDSTGNLFRFSSSLRYKKDITAYDKGLDSVLKINPVYFKSNNPNSNDRVYAGLLAEHLDEINLKEFVEYDDEDRPDSIHYQNMVALLTKAIQESHQMIQELKSELDILKNK